MGRSSAQVEVSGRRVARDLSEVPTTRMVKATISRKEAYADRQADAQGRRTSLWSGAWRKLARKDALEAGREDAGQFVAPPWRLADWSFALLAGVGGVLTTFAVFVLMSTKQVGPSPARVRAQVENRAKAATPAVERRPQAAEEPPQAPATQTVTGTASAAGTAPEADLERAKPESQERARKKPAAASKRRPRSKKP